MFNLDPSKYYLIACSGGPDSMALLDMCYRKKLNIGVAHVNYHHRDTALRDQRYVENYCQQHQLKCFVADYYDESDANFQKLARDFRYQFFKKIIDDCGFDALLVAHQMDDVLETYLFQLKRNSIPSFYGINDENTIYGIKVLRPLLKMSKKQLQDYCDLNHLEYGIDESNLLDEYQRNIIRHHELSLLNDDQRLMLLKEITDKNRYKQDIIKSIKYLLKQDKISFEVFKTLKYQDIYLNELLKHKLGQRQLQEIIRQLLISDKLLIALHQQILVKEYGYIKVFDRPYDYEYLLNDCTLIANQHFKLVKEGINSQKLAFNDDDLPLLFRNYHHGDKIKMRYGTKKVGRYFIDAKIPQQQRLNTLVVENKHHEIIFVEGIGANFSHFRGIYEVFVIKL